jgi:hypothetical protein
MWTLDMAEVGATQSRARIADAELMVRDYLSNAGFGHVRPAPEVILYRFDPITLHRARRP